MNIKSKWIVSMILLIALLIRPVYPIYAIVSVFMTYIGLVLSILLISELRSLSQEIDQTIGSETTEKDDHPFQAETVWDLLNDKRTGRMHIISRIGSCCYLISIINPDRRSSFGEKIYIQFEKYVCKRQRLPALKILVFAGR